MLTSRQRKDWEDLRNFQAVFILETLGSDWAAELVACMSPPEWDVMVHGEVFGLMMPLE